MVLIYFFIGVALVFLFIFILIQLMIKYLNSKPSIQEDIDLLLEKNSEVSEACCFGIEDELLGEKVCVAVVLKENSKQNALELKTWMSSKITREKIPEKWFFVSEIPRNDRGKVSRQNVAEYCELIMNDSEKNLNLKAKKILAEALSLNYLDIKSEASPIIYDNWDSSIMLN